MYIKQNGKVVTTELGTKPFYRRKRGCRDWSSTAEKE
jgi:hypothetical protein